KSVNGLNYIYDAGFTLGGPIKRDRLWFYGSFREWGNERQAAHKFYNATQHSPFYTPDLSRPGYAKEWYESKAIRVTWRATEKNKFNFFADPQRDCDGGLCQLQTQPSVTLSSHMERAGHQQASVRSRCGPGRWQLADLSAARS